MRPTCLRTLAASALLCAAAGCSDDAEGPQSPVFGLPGWDAGAGDGSADGVGSDGSGDGQGSGDGAGDGTGDGAADGNSSDGSAADGSDGSSADGSDEPLENFSFFVTSLSAMRELSGSQNGFGGDLSYGETSDGAGLRGADKICTEIAEMSMPGAGKKGWHAFLSTSTVNAKDRIGSGPWYDRLGRLVAQNLDDLLNERPQGADSVIVDDLPNERGEPNQAGSAENGQDDNHDVLTATDDQGNYDGGETCGDWTSTTATGDGGGSGGWPFPGGEGPGLGHSWPARSGNSWMAAHGAHGCAAGVNLVQDGPGSGDSVGAGGGYGGMYCFALEP